MSGLVPRYPPPGEQRMRLAAFARALRREARTLAERPDLLWQQLYNRLRWEGDALRDSLAVDLAPRSAPESSPWVRLALPRREVSSLVRAFAFGTETPFGPWSGMVEACAMSPDGRYVAAAGSGLGLVWEARTGQLVAELRTGNIHFCAFGPDSSWLLCAGAYDDQVQAAIWSTANWQESSFSAPRDDRSSMRAAALSEDGRVLVTALGRTLFIWDVRTGRVMRKRAEHHHAVHSCAFSPDGTLFASGDEGNMLLIWETTNWTVQREIECRLGEMLAPTVSACAITRDNRLVVAGGSGGVLRVFERSSGAEARTLRHGGGVFACAVSPDGSVLASAGDDRGIRLWDMQSGEQIAELVGHEMRPRACAFSRDGAQIVSGGDDARVLLWEATPAATLPVGPPIHSGDVLACALGASGSLVLTASRDGSAVLWRLATGEVVTSARTDGAAVVSCAISPDGAYFLTATADQHLYVWDAHTGQRIAELRAEGDAAAQPGWTSCVASPDGHWIVASLGEQLHRWDAGGWEPARSFRGHAAAIHACAISPDERWVVSGDDDGTLRVWDAASGDAVHTLESAHGPVRACAISPDGALLVAVHGRARADAPASSEDAPNEATPTRSAQTVEVWQTDAWTLQRTLTWEAEEPIACAFTPDAARVLAASGDGTVTLWELATEQPREYQLPVADLFCLAAHPRKPLVVGGGRRGEIVVGELVGIVLGPVVVTARDDEGHIAVECPGCGRAIDIEPHQLGQPMECPWPICGERMQVNVFVLQMAHPSAASESPVPPAPPDATAAPSPSEVLAEPAASAAAEPAEPLPSGDHAGATAEARPSVPESLASESPARSERHGLRRFLPGGHSR